MLDIICNCHWKKISVVFLVISLSFLSYSEGGIYDYEADADLRVEEEEGIPVSYEFSADYSHVFDGDLKQGNRDLGSISEDTYDAELVASIPLTYGTYLRLGAGSEGFLFSDVGRAPISERLISTYAVLGFDYELSDQWLLRLEARPGLYSDFEDITFSDVNVPLILGGTYLIDSNLQWIVGMLVDPWSDIAVIPAVGVRWQFADAWILNFILPKPKLEYEVNGSLTLFIGGEFKAGSFRVGEDLGTDSGMPRINDSIVSYMEARVGGGLNYSITEWLSAEIDGGIVPYRRWDYIEDSLQIKNDSALNPYIQIGIKGAF